ncbi:MAG: carboxypeptidase-like regulatory domain-containing protein [Cyclobacteriaceae bacterium]
MSFNKSIIISEFVYYYLDLPTDTKALKKVFLILLVLFLNLGVYAQVTTVKGKITEAATGTPIPFANVIFTGTQDGSVTDFDGNFSASTSQKIDSIEVRYIGFVKRIKPLEYGKSQVINFQMQEDLVTLEAVVVYPGENPAFPILRNVVKNKKSNDLRSLEAYEYESYTKIEIDVDKIPNVIGKRKIVSKITHVMDSIEQIAGEDGTPILPVFLSEAISQYYYRKNPTYKHEKVLKTKVSGVGITDGTTSSQVIGASFQQYNFYVNWVNIISKEFISPIADGWRIYYDFDLIDSLYIEDEFCYRIDFYPKRPLDLAFVGTMWIAKSDYALMRIDATIPRSANLNFIEKMKIQQDLIRTEAGAWLPHKTRVVVDAAQVNNLTPGVLAKFYVSTKDHVVNQPLDKNFYLNPISMAEDVGEYDDEYWGKARHDSLSSTEVNVFNMIDTLKSFPIVKNSVNLAKFAFNGYYKVGKVDLGPYTTFYGNNNIEGLRLGFGGRSNIALSNKWGVGGHFGYGFRDKNWKYRVYTEWITSRQPWAKMRLEYVDEIEQIWLLNENLDPNGLFYTLSRFGNLTQPFRIRKTRWNYSRQLGTGLSANVALKHEQFNSLFDFQYFSSSTDLSTSSDYTVSEVSLSARYAKDELFIIDDNNRVSLGTVRWPAFNFDYTLGLDNVLGSDFSYHKLKFSAEKRQKMAFLGISEFKLTSGVVLGEVPYPLLYNPIGNRTPVFVDFAYNLMDYFEFSTDRFIELRYKHSFEGLLLNGIPLLKRLKLRTLASANILYGGIKKSNARLTVDPLDTEGNPVSLFTSLDNRPYIELGYGVENIFRLISIQAFHRITYLDQPDVNKFGIKFNVELNL